MGVRRVIHNSPLIRHIQLTVLFVLSVRPKIAELVFQLYGRSLHPELFVIHRSRKIDRANYEAVVQITSTGHVVCWKYAGLLLTEVSAGVHQPLPERRRLMSYTLHGEQSDQLECCGGATYKTTFSLDRVDPDVFEVVQQELRLGGAKQGLMHVFDASCRLGLGAMSYINTESRERSFLVQALHTFPDDYAIVKSQSVFSLPA